MVDFTAIVTMISEIAPIFWTLVVVVILAAVFNTIVKIIKGKLLNRAKSKTQRSNVKIFSKIVNYAFLLLLLIFAFFSYSGDLGGLGLTLGLLSAALGWALQKPISGLAGWIMVVVSRPFQLGDRIIIGTVRGDVVDITLTHVHIAEIGGIAAGEENSGRVIMVPNSVLFEKNITNYNSSNEFVLDKVVVLITYESDLEKAIKLGVESAKKFVQRYVSHTKTSPYIRTYFKPNGMEVQVRYFAPANRLQEFSSNITQELFSRIRKARDVDIAYPHAEVLVRRKFK